MPTISELSRTMATSFGIDPATVRDIAAAIGLETDEPATVADAARLTIGVMVASGPDDAAERMRAYENLPLVSAQWMNVPQPDGSVRNLAFAAEDLRFEPGPGPTPARFTRTLAGFLECTIEALMSPEDLETPYMIRLAKRSHAPMAIIGTIWRDQSELILAHRNTADDEATFLLASYRLAHFADISGVTLSPIAELLRDGPASATSPQAPTIIISATAQQDASR